MPFVKLDTKTLTSTLWADREGRDVFLTALMMAEPHELKTPIEQIEVDSLQPTGWSVPPGWYGFVAAAGAGIVRMALIDAALGLEALRRLGAPDLESRSADFEGRRLVRVDGGYVVLNFQKYRDHDYSGAERMRKYRANVRKERERWRSSDERSPNERSVHPNVTQAEAEAEKTVSKNTACSSHPPGGGESPSGMTAIPPKRAASAKTQPPKSILRFADFWGAWPPGDRKQDKAKCCKRWADQRLDSVADEILADIDAKQATKKWQEGFIEGPLVYLNNRRWEDGNAEGTVNGRAWHDSSEGIQAKGIELGLGKWDATAHQQASSREEQLKTSWIGYVKRVFEAAGHKPK